MIEKYYKKNYWCDLLNKEEILDPFPKCEIKDNTIFVNLVYVNSNNNDIIDEWLLFPNKDALIGYLEYVWLPITFLSITNSNNEIIVPEITDTKSIINILKESNNIVNKEYIKDMENVNELLNNIIYDNSDNCFDDLLELQEYYKLSFSKNLDKFSYFQFFESPKVLGKYIFNEVCSDEIENEFRKIDGLTYDEWIDLCDSVEENEEKANKFLNIINNSLELLD